MVGEERGASFIVERLSQKMKHKHHIYVMFMILRSYLHMNNGWEGTSDVEISMERLSR